MFDQSLLLGLLTKCRSVLKTLPNSKIELFAGLVNGLSSISDVWQSSQYASELYEAKCFLEQTGTFLLL